MIDLDQSRRLWKLPVFRCSLLRTALMLTIVAVTFVPANNARAAEWPEQLVVGVVPAYHVERMPDTAQPVIDMLGERLGLEVSSFISPSYMGIVEAMAAGRVDVGFIGALQYVIAHDEFGVDVLLTVVRGGRSTYRAQIIASANSSIDTLEDLQGHTVGFGDIGSTSGYLYPATMLSKAGIDPERDIAPLFLGSHDNVILAVLAGDVDAGGTFEDAHTLLLEREYPDISERIRKVAVSDEIPYDTVSVRGDLPQDLKKAIARALFEISGTDAGRQALQEFFYVDGFVPATDADYEPLRDVFDRMDLML